MPENKPADDTIRLSFEFLVLTRTNKIDNNSGAAIYIWNQFNPNPDVPIVASIIASENSIIIFLIRVTSFMFLISLCGA